MKIKAAILVRQNESLELAEIETPERLRFGQVLVHVHYSGVCGSQINEIDGTKGPDRFLPHLLGHEGCATVLEIGEGVKAVKKGQPIPQSTLDKDRDYATQARELQRLLGGYQEEANVFENELTRKVVNL